MNASLISILIPMFLFYNSNGNNNPNATTSPGSKSVQNHMYDNVKRNETSDLSLSEQSSFTTSPQTERKDHQNHQNHHQQATSNGSLDRSESPTKLGMVSSKMLIVTIFDHKHFKCYKCLILWVKLKTVVSQLCGVFFIKLIVTR